MNDHEKTHARLARAELLLRTSRRLRGHDKMRHDILASAGDELRRARLLIERRAQA